MKLAVTVILVIVISLAKADQANTSERCTNACPKHLDPVCAVSGDESAATASGAVGVGIVYRYFHNDCLRRYASCSTGTGERDLILFNNNNFLLCFCDIINLFFH